jgi:hypothetical protein
MGTVALLGSALGLSASAGLSLYGTAFLAGLAIRLEWVRLAPEWDGLRILADPLVLAVAGVLFAVEWLADKVPGLDSLWDAVHTVIRPVGGALLGLRALGDLSPAAEALGVLLLGGTTLAVHAAKASARLVVNASPEPVSNVAVSVAEDGLVLAGVWLALAHPWVALGAGALAVALAVTVTAVLAGRVRRALRGLRRRRAAGAARPPA